MPGRLRREPRLMAEINVTALIDVMTVLLVIFMIVAPMAQSGLEVRVPRTEAAPLPSAEAAVVTLDREGRVFVDRVEVRPEALCDVMAQVRTSRGIQRVYVQADEAVSYGQVAGLMGQIREAGFENVGLVFEPTPAASERRYGPRIPRIGSAACAGVRHSRAAGDRERGRPPFAAPGLPGPARLGRRAIEDPDPPGTPTR